MKYNLAIVLAWFEERKLPAPVTEMQFHPERKWRFDFAWIEQRLALEVEGGAWSGGRHTRGSGFTSDIEKYNEATRLGWRVLRCVPADLCTVAVADLLLTCLNTVGGWCVPVKIKSKR